MLGDDVVCHEDWILGEGVVDPSIFLYLDYYTHTHICTYTHAHVHTHAHTNRIYLLQKKYVAKFVAVKKFGI